MSETKSTKSIKSTKSTKLTKSTKSTNIDNLINELIQDPTLFILNNNASTILQIIKYTTDKYYNEQSIISDDIYDFLIDTIKDIDPDNSIFKIIGAKVVKNKAKLKYFMGSMDKIKPSDLNQLKKFTNTYKHPYVYSDKLDGVSALLTYNDNKLELFTRGDGYIGSNISGLIKYIPSLRNIKMSESMAVRGELIMKKDKFIKYQDKMANARNMVSGIVNSKTIIADRLLDVEFVSYELINPWIYNQSDQWTQLIKCGFIVVKNGLINNLDPNSLSQILSERKIKSNYEIDGIIISVNNLPSERSSNSNPEYAFAYKNSDLSEKALVNVLNVEWSISKDGYIKPKLNIEPTKLSGVTISNVTAFNAKYVKDNVLGPGAIIELIRSGDVIPHIVRVIKPATNNLPQLPNDIEFTWSTSNVDIIASVYGIEQQIKNLTFFIKKLNIQNIDESTIEKLINAGINTIEKIIQIKHEQLSNIDGIGEKMSNKIYQHISQRMLKLTILDLMVASNVFGHGLGDVRIRRIMETYPDIIELYINNSSDEIIEKIKMIDGFDIITAEHFEIGLEKFIELFNKLEPNMKKQLRISICIFKDQLENIISNANDSNNKFANKIFIFSGFRNKKWEEIIILNGGKIGTSISSKTTLLISTKSDIDNLSNSKIIKAKELNISIMSKEEFEHNYFN
jgi:DNA ligase (NAD+)